MNEAETIEFLGEIFRIVRRPRFNGFRVSLDVREGSRVVVSKSQSETEIRRFLSDKKPWILRVRARLEKIRLAYPILKVEDGAFFPLHGRTHVLRVVPVPGMKRPRVEIVDGSIQLRMPPELTAARRIRALQDFYRREGVAVLQNRVAHFSQVLGLFPSALTFRNQKTRWGSCSPRGRISLNWRLAAVPPEVLDYVVIHELCHLRHPNHSMRFWQLVESVCPKYEESRAWLRLNQFSLDFLSPLVAAD